MNAVPSEVEHTKLLVGQSMAANTVTVQNARVRRETRQDRRRGIAFGPIEHIRQDSPVRLILQIRMARFRPRDDNAVKMVLPHFVKTVVEVVQMTLTTIGSHDSRQ